MVYIKLFNIIGDMIEIEKTEDLYCIKLLHLLLLNVDKYIIIKLLKDNDIIIHGFIDNNNELVYKINLNDIDENINYLYIKYDGILQINKYFTYDIYIILIKSCGYYKTNEEYNSIQNKCIQFLEEINFINIINSYLNYNMDRKYNKNIIKNIISNIFTINKIKYLIENKYLDFIDINRIMKINNMTLEKLFDIFAGDIAYKIYQIINI